MRQKPHKFSVVSIYSELQSRHILGLSLDQSNFHINLQPCENYIWWFSFPFINLMVASSTILKLLYAGGFLELLCIQAMENTRKPVSRKNPTVLQSQELHEVTLHIGSA